MSPTSGKIRVLLIEDSQTDARLIREVLFREAPHGFEIEHVERLNEGLARLARRDVDVILLDLTLPFDLRDNGVTTRTYFKGGLLGHWSVWTTSAIKQFEMCKAARGKETDSSTEQPFTHQTETGQSHHQTTAPIGRQGPGHEGTR